MSDDIQAEQPPQIDWNNMRAVQIEINRWANTVWPNRTFKNAFDKLVYEEIPELLIHHRQFGPENIGKELADNFVLLMDLAEIWQVDLAAAIEEKMQILYRETWTTDPETGIAKRSKIENIENTEAYPPTCPDCSSAKHVRRVTEGPRTHEYHCGFCFRFVHDDIPF